jgi:hypothetical protein
MPVAVELKGLLPGRGPGLGTGRPEPGAAGRGPGVPAGRGAAGRGWPVCWSADAAGCSGWRSGWRSAAGNGVGTAGDDGGSAAGAAPPSACAGRAGACGALPFVLSAAGFSVGAICGGAGAGPACAVACTASACGAGWLLRRPFPPLGWDVANASFSLRTTGASIVEDADLTNSPISLSLAITALLSTPNSFASS